MAQKRKYLLATCDICRAQAKGTEREAKSAGTVLRSRGWHGMTCKKCRKVTRDIADTNRTVDYERATNGW